MFVYYSLCFCLCFCVYLLVCLYHCVTFLQIHKSLHNSAAPCTGSCWPCSGSGTRAAAQTCRGRSRAGSAPLPGQPRWKKRGLGVWDARAGRCASGCHPRPRRRWQLGLALWEATECWERSGDCSDSDRRGRSHWDPHSYARSVQGWPAPAAGLFHHSGDNQWWSGVGGGLTRGWAAATQP